MKPSVSVVIATYNYGRFLPEAIESVLYQTFADLELIIIDDGSTDNTSCVVRPYQGDERLRYTRTNHRGQPAAKNCGIRLARAPLVAFLDGDDVWLPAKLARQVALFRADRDLGVAYTRRWLIDEQGQSLEYAQPRLHRGRVLEALFRTNFVCFSSAMVRRAVLDEVGLFDETLPLAIDYDLWLRIAPRYRFDYVDEPLVCYRTGHANLSCQTERRLAAVTGIMRRFLDECGGRGMLAPAIIRRAEAETCCHIGLACRRRSRWAALPWYIRSLFLSPDYGPAWKGLVSLPLPEALRRCLRRILGRPVDWSLRPPLRSLPPPGAVLNLPMPRGVSQVLELGLASRERQQPEVSDR